MTDVNTLHINNSGDSALMEAMQLLLSEARSNKQVLPAGSDRLDDLLARREHVSRTTNDPNEKGWLSREIQMEYLHPTKPNAPKPDKTWVNDKEKKRHDMYVGIQQRIKEGEAVKGLVADGERGPTEYTVRPGIRTHGSHEDGNAQNRANNRGQTAKKIAGKLTATAALAAGRQAIRDYADHGDALYTAKKVKSSVDNKIAASKAKKAQEKEDKAFNKKVKAEYKRQVAAKEEKAKEREHNRAELQKKYNQFKDSTKKRLALAEDFDLDLDESTGVFYYTFSIPGEVY